MDELRNLEILITSRTALTALESLQEVRAEKVADLREWARGRAVPVS